MKHMEGLQGIVFLLDMRPTKGRKKNSSFSSPFRHWPWGNKPETKSQQDAYKLRGKTEKTLGSWLCWALQTNWGLSTTRCVCLKNFLSLISEHEAFAPVCNFPILCLWVISWCHTFVMSVIFISFFQHSLSALIHLLNLLFFGLCSTWYYNVGPRIRRSWIQASIVAFNICVSLIKVLNLC